MLLLRANLLDERRSAASGPLASLTDSLAKDLERLITDGVHVPEHKAVLSRAGGRCEDDGSQLEFDPYSPQKHRCAVCGKTYADDDWHYRAWLYPYQLWLAERAVHGAFLHLLRGDDRHRALAMDIISQYADAYLKYPNRDNVLGPARVFFSTYLESIWLLQICIATDLLAAGGERESADLARERIILPAAELIAQYDEGGSNRQVWNNAALMAAAFSCGRKGDAERLLRAPSGVEAHLSMCLLPDGTWYEGENYHLFAHRGLWYCVTMAEAAGLELPSALLDRFAEGFAAPFATALPDLTLPSRKDSQYAISLRQWRYAELCELGLARTDDRRLVAALAQLYDDNAEPGDTGRSRSSADVERNTAPVRLTRADLGWRALLHARTVLPELSDGTPASAHLPFQGYTAFRRERGDVYVALDWGQSGGGHGHPDRLNVVFAHGNTRWLDDLGTGSYVDPSLHWYRSTLAHNAPLVNGMSQLRVNGTLLAHEERGGVGWILATANIAPGVTVERALVVTPDYFVDEIRWRGEQAVRFELPVHFPGDSAGLDWHAADLDGGTGLEDGFGFVKDVCAAKVAAREFVTLDAARDGRRARAWFVADGDASWFRASAPGQPASQTRQFQVIRCVGAQGAIRSVWAWSPRVTDVRSDGDRLEVLFDGERHVQYRTPEYWQMELLAGDARSGIELYGWQPAPPPRPYAPPPADARPPITLVRGGPPVEFVLGEEHYRRSEDTWLEAGCPRAKVSIAATERELQLHVVADANHFKYGPRSFDNPYDNEHVDIHYPGAQIYVRTPDDGGAWVVRPRAGERVVEIRRLEEWGALQLTLSNGELHTHRYELRLHVALPAHAAHGAYPVAVDALVNDAPRHRWRRRGQLVLSGAPGEFVYLRGDRHDPNRLLRFVIVDRPPGESHP